MDKKRIYVCIDLKSFYASVECMERNLNPLTTNLVVADASRTDKTICLAVTPSLKKYGIPGRLRLFEVKAKIKEVNEGRKRLNNIRSFVKESYNDLELTANPDYAISFIIATPQMAKYVMYSSKIYRTYLKYISAEDIHVYSIDEVFMDVTDYLNGLKMTARELAQTIIHEVLKETGITATVGIGTNMYLAKIAMDIVAKHVPADENGARIAELDEMKYRKELWHHEPITDFWRVGHGYAERLKQLNIKTMGDIARLSLKDEEMLYDTFGINAELLIDHAWGFESATMRDVKNYRPELHSLSTGQVLHSPYSYNKTKLIIKEMTDLLSLDLVDKKLVTNQIGLAIGYDTDNLSSSVIASHYQGEIETDYFGRKVPKGVHGSCNLDKPTASSKLLTEAILTIFERIANPILKVRRINIVANNTISEEVAKKQTHYQQFDIFTDFTHIEELDKQKEQIEQKEKKAQKAILDIKKRYGKNAILKGMNLEEGGTTIDRNKQIGGHKE